MTNNIFLNEKNDDEARKVPLKRGKPYREFNFGWERIKTTARAMLIRHPRLGVPLIRLWRRAKMFLLRLKWKLAIFKGTLNGTYCKDIDAERLYWISPQKIEYISLTAFPLSELKGHVIGGDWDSLRELFCELDVYIAFRQVFIEGRKWEDTVFYGRILERLKKGEILWGCKNKQDFDRRCKYLEHLFFSIKNNGYKSQQELRAEDVKGAELRYALEFNVWEQTHHDNEVSVCIGRAGDFLFCDGAHRLTIAKLLDIPKIPVRVVVRHPEWMKFRGELQLYANELGGRTYQPPLHADLDEIEFNHECEDRLRVIMDNLSSRQGKLLDIGANLGFFCHKFEEARFDCYAVEDSQVNLYFLKAIKRAEGRKFRIIAESVLESKYVVNTQFDVVLALNIFHHFLKTKQAYAKFLELLNNIKTKELFFESHLQEEPQMRGAYKNYSPEEFVRLILDNTTLSKAEFLSKAKDGRSLYKLY